MYQIAGPALLLVALMAFPAAMAADLPGNTTGSQRALALVSGISAERLAMAQIKAPKPVTGAESVASGALPLKTPALSRFEVTGGTDRLFFTRDVLKQASIFGEVRYRLGEKIQFGGTGAVRLQGDGHSTEIALQALFGPTYNFGSDASFRDAWFFSPKAGVTVSRTTAGGQVRSTAASPTVSFIVGKRFSVGDHLAFAPSVGLIQEGGQSPFLSVTPVALSFFF